MIFQRKRNFITDSDFNRLATLMDSFKRYDSYPRRFRVYTAEPSVIMTLIKKIYSDFITKIEIGREGGNKQFVRIESNTKGNSTALEMKLRAIKTTGPIVGYDTDGEAYSQFGDKVALTGTPGKNLIEKAAAGEVKPIDNGAPNNLPGTSSGINTTTIIIAVVAVIGLVFLLKKKKE